MVLFLVVGITYAAFVDKATFSTSTFSVGSADIRLLPELDKAPNQQTPQDELQGPEFLGISPDWVVDFPVKVYNNSGSPINLMSFANYETANDPHELRYEIDVEPMVWDDSDGDGIPTEAELSAPLGKKNFVKWKSEGFDLGTLAASEVKGVVLRFSTGSSMPKSTEGSTGVFDFQFISTGQ